MKRVNLGRVILGGLLAGIVYNISAYLLNDVVLKASHQADLKALGKTMPEGGSTLVVWILLGFALGIASVRLYAAIRPRYGPGPGTAVRAGFAVWFFSDLFLAVVLSNLGVFPINVLGLAWNLAAAILATVLGAWLYREEEA